MVRGGSVAYPGICSMMHLCKRSFGDIVVLSLMIRKEDLIYFHQEGCRGGTFKGKHIRFVHGQACERKVVIGEGSILCSAHY